MARVKQRTPELRDRVVDVAVSTLCEDGMSGFTTRRVAQRAGTSVPAVYELFSDKDGLLRAVFFEGFRRLGGELVAIPETSDELGDLRAVIPVFRRFCLDYPALARVMFSRPFQDLDPDPEQLAAAPTVREILVGKVQRCIDAGLLAGDAVDISHVLLALAQGLAVQEAGRWLGKSADSVNRRWDVGVQAVLAGFHA
ncbi:TetR/AcrR family transcriptional regulator [Mycobacterium crocinum]|uniref:TetR/AcrR family transcriptional regulator n=1 Tax=Mycolicibacterium crocinum TaxID=388459 RepID=A0ABY3TMG3_9MYCO|nr:TetR/AcrR family transcriptional regulator [Mycolicibacterium crocinum]APE16691.1 TetR family transcriptional regulator [Mycobacterium sp. WY10]MCV7217669.1 TetR/AcrR family transcriptional regulator [Mycolicibacterium crocinum]ULN42541.1 TetR/AcrR family transcriptional regulator [Mycolicibacterium crocinum]